MRRQFSRLPAHHHGFGLVYSSAALGSSVSGKAQMWQLRQGTRKTQLGILPGSRALLSPSSPPRPGTGIGRFPLFKTRGRRSDGSARRACERSGELLTRSAREWGGEIPFNTTVVVFPFYRETNPLAQRTLDVFALGAGIGDVFAAIFNQFLIFSYKCAARRQRLR